MSKIAVRGCFLAVLLLFALQMAVVMRLPEPYPALLLPSFVANGIRYDEDFRLASTEMTVRFASGRQDSVSRGELFAMAPESLRAAMMRRLAPVAGVPVSATGKVAMAERAGAYLPGLRALVKQLEPRASVDPRTRDWLRARLARMYPGPDPVRELRVDVLTDTYRFGAVAVSRRREVVSTLTVRFE